MGSTVFETKRVAAQLLKQERFVNVYDLPDRPGLTYGVAFSNRYNAVQSAARGVFGNRPLYRLRVRRKAA